MYTVDTALESLKKYDISEPDLLGWEKELDLDITVDNYGRKQYSPHHINLFKNIKKHLALGRTLDEIRQIINLPPLMKSRPQGQPISKPENRPLVQPQSPEKRPVPILDSDIPMPSVLSSASRPVVQPKETLPVKQPEPKATFDEAIRNAVAQHQPVQRVAVSTQTPAPQPTNPMAPAIQERENSPSTEPQMARSTSPSRVSPAVIRSQGASASLTPTAIRSEESTSYPHQQQAAIASQPQTTPSAVQQQSIQAAMAQEFPKAQIQEALSQAEADRTTRRVDPNIALLEKPVTSEPSQRAPETASIQSASVAPQLAPDAGSSSPSVDKSIYASVPKPPAMRKTAVTSGAGSSGAANVINLVQRLTREKDQLYKKLLETEKLNSHLYSANNLFHKKVRDMTRQIVDLRESIDENEKFKLMDDKARLHKQLLDTEKLAAQRQEEIQNQTAENGRQKTVVRELEKRIQSLTVPFDSEKFKGDWMENGKLVEVIYDNFGINIDPERVRLFRISDKPGRRYGNMAVINTSYQYESNNLWKRDETLSVAYMDENLLEGELTAEYILDGVPVAKALYRVTCRRHQD